MEFIKEYIKKGLSKPTDWLLLGVVICLTVLVFYSRNVKEHLTSSENNTPTTDPTVPTIPAVNVNVGTLPVSQEALRQAIGEVYRADISAIKNLSDIANALQSGKGIQVPGKLVVNGETDLMGSVYKLKVAGETNLEGSLNVKGETNLASSLNVKGETNLSSSLSVVGVSNLNTLNVKAETNLANLAVSKYVATDANKNLVSLPYPDAILSYSNAGNSSTAIYSGKDITIDGSESGVVGISNNSNKLTNTSGKTVTCLVKYTYRVFCQGGERGRVFVCVNGNQYSSSYFSHDGNATYTDSTVVQLKPNDYISIQANYSKGDNASTILSLIVSVTGLFYY